MVNTTPHSQAISSVCFINKETLTFGLGSRTSHLLPNIVWLRSNTWVPVLSSPKRMNPKPLDWPEPGSFFTCAIRTKEIRNNRFPESLHRFIKANAKWLSIYMNNYNIYSGIIIHNINYLNKRDFAKLLKIFPHIYFCCTERQTENNQIASTLLWVSYSDLLWFRLSVSRGLFDLSLTWCVCRNS